MQGTDGLGQGLTTYPTSADPLELETHASCEALEGEGRVVRHLDAVNYAPGVDATAGKAFVIWMPLAVESPPEGGMRRRSD